MNIFDFYHTGKNINSLLSLIEVYPTNSKKRIVLKLLNAINQIGPKIFTLKKEIRFIDNKLNEINERAFRSYLIHQFERKKRIYIYEYFIEKKTISFTKYSVLKKDYHSFKAEFKNLRYLNKKVSFVTPIPEKVYSFEKNYFFSMISLSNDFKILDKKESLPNYIFEEIANLRPKNLPTKIKAKKIDGWKECLNKSKNMKIIEIGTKINPEKLFSVVAAHRDLGSENIFSKKNPTSACDYAIIDWEFFTDTAPELTDKVGIWLGKKHIVIKKRNLKLINEITIEFLEYFSIHKNGRESSVLALLHLASIGIDLAKILICQFDE